MRAPRRLRDDPSLWEDLAMIFQQFLNEETGCLSYLIGCGQAGEAAVVDPGRDRVDEYAAVARRKGLRITEIIETHVHADHVSGNQALAAKCGARLRIHPAAHAAYPHATIEDGETLSIGSVALKVLHTPGHTPDSVSLLVTDTSRGGEPWFVLTGDTLFIGDVGRPDLQGGQGLSPEFMARQLYRSLHTSLLTLPDATRVYPAHGAGSACGKNLSTEKASTIGEQRRSNYALRLGSAEDFVAAVTEGQPPQPGYFARVAELNRESHQLADVEEPQLLTLDQVLRLAAGGAAVLDEDEPAARPEDPPYFSQRPCRVRDRAEGPRRDHGVNRGVRQRDRLSRGLHEPHRKPGTLCSPTRHP